jgi:hypothetical protein
LKRRLLSRILKDPRDVLLDAAKKSTAPTTVEANEVPADALIAVDTVKSVSNNALTEILKDDLSYNPKTHSYHIISDGKTSVTSSPILCQK